MRRRRAARKNSDSGVSVGSSVGLNTSENSMDRVEISRDQLTWYPPPKIRLDATLPNIVPPENKTVLPSEPSPADISDEDVFTITTGLNGRTVNGQLFVVQPEPTYVHAFTYDVSSDESEGGEICSKKWNRFFVDYNLLEVTSNNEVFEGARLDDSQYLLDYSREEDNEHTGSWTQEEFVRSSLSGFNNSGNSDRCEDVSSVNYGFDMSHYRCPESSETTVSSQDTSVCEESLIHTPIIKRPRITYSQSNIQKESPPVETNTATKIVGELTENNVKLQNVKTFKIPKLKKPYERINYQHQMDDDQLSIHISSDLEIELERDLDVGTSSHERNKFAREKTAQSSEFYNINTPRRYISWERHEKRKHDEAGHKNSNETRISNNGKYGENKFLSEANSSNNKNQTNCNEMFNNFNENYQKRFIKETRDEADNITHFDETMKPNTYSNNIIQKSTSTAVHDVDERIRPVFSSPNKIFNDRNNEDLVHGNNNLNQNQYSDFNPYNMAYRNDLHSISNTNQLSSNSSSNLNDFNNRLNMNPPYNNMQSNINQLNDFVSRQPSSNINEIHSSSNATQCNNYYPINSSNPTNFTTGGQQQSQHWNSENNEQLMRKPSDLSTIVYRMCRNMEVCRLTNCRYAHEVPMNFEELLCDANIRDIQNVSRYLLTRCHDSCISQVIPKILMHHSIQKNLNEILNMTTFINIAKHLQQETRFYLMQQAVKNIMDSDDKEYDFKSAIKEIIMYNGTKSVISELILYIIVERKDFLIECNELVFDLMRHREKCPSTILNAFLKECIRMRSFGDDIKRVCYRNVLKYLEQNSNNKRINLKSIDTFSRILAEMGLEDSAESLQKVFPPPAIIRYSIGSNNCGDVSILPENVLSDKLCDFILERNLVEVANVFRANIQQPHKLSNMFAAIHEKKAVANSALVAVFEDIVHILDYSRTEGNLKLAIETVGFNLVPLFDREKDYENGAKVICIFKESIKSLISVKSYSNVAPYKDNLKNEPEKLVLLLKILSRANVLNVAFTLIKMPEFDCNVHSFLKYKASVIDEFLLNVSKKDKKFVWEVLEYLLNSNTDDITELTIRKHYNHYLEKYLNSKEENIFIDEYRKSIKHYYKLINCDLLRAIVANLFKVIRLTDIEPLYDCCCSHGIYIPNCSLEKKIKLRNNLTKDEIKLVFEMFFLKALKLNRPPTEIKIVLVDMIDQNVSPVELGSFKSPAKCDEKSMLMRLCASLFSFQPPIDISDDPETLSLDMVKKCLEATRRKT